MSRGPWAGLKPDGFHYIKLCSPVGTGGACDTSWHLRDGICGSLKAVSAGKRPVEKDWGQKGSVFRPTGNAGILVGKDEGFLCADTDGQDEEAVYKSWAMPDTRTHRTGKGHHYFFEWPEGRERLPQRVDGILLRGSGKTEQVVAPGSTHWKGSTYAVELDLPMAQLPEHFLTRQGEEEEKKTFGQPVTEGSRRDYIVSMVGLFLYKELPIDTTLCAVRHFNENYVIPALEDSELKEVVTGMYRRYGQPRTISASLSEYGAAALFEKQTHNPEPHPRIGK